MKVTQQHLTTNYCFWNNSFISRPCYIIFKLCTKENSFSLTSCFHSPKNGVISIVKSLFCIMFVISQLFQSNLSHYKWLSIFQVKRSITSTLKLILKFCISCQKLLLKHRFMQWIEIHCNLVFYTTYTTLTCLLHKFKYIMFDWIYINFEVKHVMNIPLLHWWAIKTLLNELLKVNFVIEQCAKGPQISRGN